jgi:hypothetical protein
MHRVSALLIASAVPVVAVLAADAPALPALLPQADGWIGIVMQLGVGGIVAFVAVKMLLGLYKDKETSTRDYNAQMLEMLRQQIAAMHETRDGLRRVEEALERHQDDFRRSQEGRPFRKLAAQIEQD